MQIYYLVYNLKIYKFFLLCMFVFICVSRPEVSVECLLQLLFTLLYKARSFSLKLELTTSAGWSASARDLTVTSSFGQCLLQGVLFCLFLNIGSGDSNSLHPEKLSLTLTYGLYYEHRVREKQASYRKTQYEWHSQ